MFRGIDYYALFELAAAIMTVAIVPSVLLRYYGWSGVRKAQEVRAKSVQVFRQITNHPRLGGVILYTMQSRLR